MIAITGHTAGLGKAIYDRHAPLAIGFSRSNGFDISDPVARAAIIEQSSGCDVFINNAYSGFAQVDILYAMHDRWNGTDKLIINISSNSGDGIKPMPHKYAIQKSALDKASEQLSRTKGACRIINVRPGYIDTARVNEVVGHPKLSTEHVADVIDYLMSMPHDVCPVEITLLPRSN